MLNVFLVGIGGMVGSMLRYGVSMLPMECGDGFPIKTLLYLNQYINTYS